MPTNNKSLLLKSGLKNSSPASRSYADEVFED